MNFKEELRIASQKAIEDAALAVSIEIQPTLKEYAVNGQAYCFMDIPNDQMGLMLNEAFIKLLKDLLDGVQVEVVERNLSVLFPSLKRKFIKFSW